MNDTVLQVQGLRKNYPAFTLSEVSFSLEAGRIMGFIGRNGAGKTTTLKSILGLVHPDAGEIRYFGLPFAQNEQRIKEQIGYAAGGTSYYQRRRVGEIARMTASFYPGWDDAAYRNYLRRFSLDESKCLRELSEGMKVKFLLTLALSHHAKLLLLDEPTSGLDPVSRNELTELLRRIAADGQRSVLFSTHITSDLEKCASHITFIKDGTIQHTGTLADFRQHYDYLRQPGQELTLEDIIVSVERRPLDENAIV